MIALGPPNVSPMPEPGDLIEAFSPQPGRCFRMVYSVQLQATHCRQEPAWNHLAGPHGEQLVRGSVPGARSIASSTQSCLTLDTVVRMVWASESSN